MYDFQFTPKPEEELIDLLEDGNGHYEIISFEKKENKDGYPMAKFNLKVWDKNGRQGFITVFIVFNGSNFSLRIFRQLCYSCRMPDAYELGKFNGIEFVGKSGPCLIGTQKGSVGKDGKYYHDKNVIKEFLTNIDESMSQLYARQKARENDDLPPVDAYNDIPL